MCYLRTELPAHPPAIVLQLGGSAVVLDVILFDCLTIFGGQNFFSDIGGGGSSGVVVYNCASQRK